MVYSIDIIHYLSFTTTLTHIKIGKYHIHHQEDRRYQFYNQYNIIISLIIIIETDCAYRQFAKHYTFLYNRSYWQRFPKIPMQIHHYNTIMIFGYKKEDTNFTIKSIVHLPTITVNWLICFLSGVVMTQSQFYLAWYGCT